MRSALRWIVCKMATALPPTRAYGLKRTLWRFAGVELGTNVRIVSTARFIGSGAISVGDDSFIGHDVIVLSTSEVRIGARCDVGPRVMIVDGTHEIGASGRRAGRGFALPVTVGDGTWIGAGAILTAGARVGRGVVVAAGAVVTSRSALDVDVLLAGTPAQIKRRLEGSSAS